MYPWYIESDQWSIAFDQNEKVAFFKIAKGEVFTKDSKTAKQEKKIFC